MKKMMLSCSLMLLLLACKYKENDFDATGTFESNEVIVSAKQSGELVALNIKEGDKLAKNQQIGSIDVSNVLLQKQQLNASLNALKEKLNIAKPQIAITEKQLLVQESQLKYLLHEKARIERLLESDAATQKQLDDMNEQVDATRKQIDVSKQQIASYESITALQNRSILSETDPFKKQIAEIDDQINKGSIINHISGIVLTQYAFQGEMTSVGKALYKIANVDTLILRAYITGNQLPQVKLQQKVTVHTDDGKGGFNATEGTISWISDKAEFTPKTIQTKSERADIVYAIKVLVKNDGMYKIGMYGEVKF